MANLSNINNKFLVTTGGHVLIGATSTYPQGDNTILKLYSPSVPRFYLQNTTTGSNITDGSQIYVSGSDLYITNSESANTIFSTNSLERMRIDSSGNSTFTGMIMVNGDGIDIDNNDNLRLRFDNASVFKAGLQVATSTGDMITSSVTNDFAIRSQSNMLFATGGSTERMRITDIGQIGMGTTLPVSNLQVYSTAATNSYSTTITKNGNMAAGLSISVLDNDDSMTGIFFSTGGSTHWSGITGSRTDESAHWGTQLNFYTHNNDVTALNDATQKMVIKGDGNVGIGVTGPGALLDVGGYVQMDSYVANGSGNNAFNSGYLKIIAGAKTGWGIGDELGKINFFGNDTSGVGARNAASIVAVCETGNGTSTTTFSSGLAFYTSSYNAAQEERMRITSGGNIDITGGGILKGMSVIELLNDGSPYASATSPRFYSPASGTLGISCAGAERMRLKSDGVLDLFGTIQSSGNQRFGAGPAHGNSSSPGITTKATTTSGVYWTGTGAGGWGGGNFTTNNSDRNMKTNIVPMDIDALKIIDSLETKYFNWTEKANRGDTSIRKAGIIAQDLRELMPEGVYGTEWDDDDENTNGLSLDENATTALLIKAIQELKADNDSLKARIETLENN